MTDLNSEKVLCRPKKFVKFFSKRNVVHIKNIISILETFDTAKFDIYIEVGIHQKENKK